MSAVYTDFTIHTENISNDEYAHLLHFLIHATEFVYEKTSDRSKIACSVTKKISVEEFTETYRIPDACKVTGGRAVCVVKYH